MTKVLFVCLGNICRSPMAEAIFNDKIQKSGLVDKFITDSCGTADFHVGDRPDHRTIRILEKNGIETRHLGRQFEAKDFEAFDLIVAMDSQNEKDILKLASNQFQKNKIVKMRSYETPNENLDVPDPYYGNIHDFEKVYTILDNAIENLIKSIV